MVLGQLYHTIVHISGEWKCWEDLTSRWLKVPSVDVKATAVHTRSKPDKAMPLKDVIRTTHQENYVVWWIPSQAIDLQLRLMAYAHMKEVEHRGVAATLQLLQEY